VAACSLTGSTVSWSATVPNSFSQYGSQSVVGLARTNVRGPVCACLHGVGMSGTPQTQATAAADGVLVTSVEAYFCGRVNPWACMTCSAHT
jgi:hypothetical protein